uniref:Uncharacterized protein n=1 Tax=Arundo donax TaxID=35708 RepID=A0A0A9HF50_ARUDO
MEKFQESYMSYERKLVLGPKKRKLVLYGVVEP